MSDQMINRTVNLHVKCLDSRHLTAHFTFGHLRNAPLVFTPDDCGDRLLYSSAKLPE